MSKKYLDKDGLTYFWGKVKNEIPDLTNYVTNTDYATSDKGGVIKIWSSRAIQINTGGLEAKTIAYSNYSSMRNDAFIGKGTLENVITGKGLLDSGDLKTINSTSVVGSGNIDTKEVHISTTAPTDDTVIWIDPNEVVTRQEMSIKTSYDDSNNNAYSTHYINNLNKYSTSEKFTGKYWIDGKPIYRRIFFDSNVIVDTSYVFQTGITNIDEVIEFKGLFNLDGEYQKFPTVYYDSNGYEILNCLFRKSDCSIRIVGHGYWGGRTTRILKFIIEYTKTS